MAKLTNDTVSVLEDLASPHWITVLRFVATYHLFLYRQRRIQGIVVSTMCRSGRDAISDLDFTRRRERSIWNGRNSKS